MKKKQESIYVYESVLKNLLWSTGLYLNKTFCQFIPLITLFYNKSWFLHTSLSSLRHFAFPYKILESVCQFAKNLLAFLLGSFEYIHYIKLAKFREN